MKFLIQILILLSCSSFIGAMERSIKPVLPQSDTAQAAPIRVAIKREAETRDEATEEETVQSKKHKKDYECTFQGCGKVFPKSSNLIRHSLTHTQIKRFPCTFLGCDKNFLQRDYVVEHIIRVHLGEKAFICPKADCKKAFAHAGDRARHMLSHTGQKPYTCDNEGCSQAFARASNLKRHSLTHSKEMPYTCSSEGCTKAFSQRGNLRRHMATHAKN